MLIFGYRRSFNKPGRAEKLSHHGFSFQIDTFNYHNKIHVIFRFQMIPSYKIHAVSFVKCLLNKRNMFLWSCTEEQ